jgi:Glycosyltransferase family 87
VQPLPAPLQIPALAVALACVVATSLACARLLRVERTLPLLLAVAVLSCAQVVIAVEALSLLHAIGPGGLLLAHAVPLAALLAARVRPAPLRVGARLAALRDDVAGTRSPAVFLLLATTAATAVVLAYLVVVVPPNTYDGLQYHLTRTYTYLQQASLDAYPTPDLRETVLPANAEILALWPLAFWPQQYTPGLVQLLAWLGCGLAVYGLARRSDCARAPAALAALVFMALPASILQATSTQVDLVAAFFVVGAFFFAAERRPAAAVLCGLALGLALGTKTTAAFAVPGLAAWAVLWAVRAEPEHRGRVRRLAALSAAAALGFALCGAYVYLQNLRRHGHPSGPAAFRNVVALSEHYPRALWSNVGRLAIRLCDPGGSAPPGTEPARWLHGVYERLSQTAMRRLSIREKEAAADFDHPDAGWSAVSALKVDEDVTLFGALFAPLLALALARAVLRRDRAALLLIGSAAAYLLILAAALRFQIWNGRFLMTFGVLVAPALAGAFSGRGMPAGALALLVAAASAGSQYVCALHNAHKSFLGANAMRDTRLERLRLASRGAESMVRILDARQPQPARVALFAGLGDLRAHLFGERLERRLVAQDVGEGEPLPSARFDGFDAVLFTSDKQAAFRRHLRPRGSPYAPYWYVSDLRPLLAELEAPGSGWRPVVRSLSAGALFVRATAPAAEYPPELDRLPAVGEWGDTWIGPRLVTLVSAAGVDAIEVEGELLDIGALGDRTFSIKREAAAAPGEPQRIAPGLFRLRLDLGPRTASDPEFVAVEVRCAPFYNPFKAGVSADDRDLAWRLRGVHSIRSLSAASPARRSGG